MKWHDGVYLSHSNPTENGRIVGMRALVLRLAKTKDPDTQKPRKALLQREFKEMLDLAQQTRPILFGFLAQAPLKLECLDDRNLLIGRNETVQYESTGDIEGDVAALYAAAAAIAPGGLNVRLALAAPATRRFTRSVAAKGFIFTTVFGDMRETAKHLQAVAAGINLRDAQHQVSGVHVQYAHLATHFSALPTCLGHSCLSQPHMPCGCGPIPRALGQRGEIASSTTAIDWRSCKAHS